MRRSKMEYLTIKDAIEVSEFLILHDFADEKGAVVAGEIEVDLSDLREQGLVAAQRYDENSPWYWRVDYDLVMEVEGLNLKFYVRWPREGGVYGQPGRISLVAAFRPGTA
jgi:hypothetical protein